MSKENTVNQPNEAVVQDEQNSIMAEWSMLSLEAQNKLLPQLIQNNVSKTELNTAPSWLEMTPFTILTRFPNIRISRADLEAACFTDDEIALLSDDDIVQIGISMRQHFMHEYFWPSVQYATEAILANKQKPKISFALQEEMQKDANFGTWLTHVDEHMWLHVGCSVFDLPDQQFKEWFDQGVEVGEAVNLMIELSGI